LCHEINAARFGAREGEWPIGHGDIVIETIVAFSTKNASSRSNAAGLSFWGFRSTSAHPLIPAPKPRHGCIFHQQSGPAPISQHRRCAAASQKTF
jgi:hypothetical protein